MSVITGVAQNVGSQVTAVNVRADAYGLDYDTTNNRVIIAYKDGTNNDNFGYVVVGTISNESITFGTPVLYEGNTINMVRVVYDPNANKAIIFHRLISGDAIRYAVISLSGSTVTVNYSGIFTNNSTDWIAVTYDSNINRAILFYEDNNYGSSRICTIGASSLTFSNASDYDTSTYHGTVNAVFDTTNNKIFVLYERASTLYIKMGTPNAAATSISWGNTQTVGTGNNAGMAYDSENDLLVVAYKDSSFSPNRGTIKTATIAANGTDLDFSSPTYFLTGSPVPNYLTDGVVYDSVAKKTNVFWTDSSTNEPYLTPVVVDSSGTITAETNVKLTTDNGYLPNAVFCNGTTDRVYVIYKDIANNRITKSNVIRNGSTDLTESNFIGFSDGSYSNGQTATVLINGSVTDDQTGLTPATKYYVDGSGNLTTSASNSVYAGIAVSSAKLIIKA